MPSNTEGAILGKLMSAEWMGSMCLTVVHYGSNLALLCTKAEVAIEGSNDPFNQGKLTTTEVYFAPYYHP